MSSMHSMVDVQCDRGQGQDHWRKSSLEPLPSWGEREDGGSLSDRQKERTNTEREETSTRHRLYHTLKDSITFITYTLAIRYGLTFKLET